MALRFADPGGAIYQTAGTGGANILAHWTLAGQIANWSVSAGNGRIPGTPSLRVTNLNTLTYLGKTISTSAQTLGAAMAVRFPTTIPVGGVPAILAFNDNGSGQVDLRVTTAGTLQVTRNGTVLGTSSAALSTNVYYHIEFKAKIDPTVGTVEVRLNGVPVVGPLTAQNTRATANSTVNQVVLGNGTPANSSSTFEFCDLVIWDGDTTTDANGFTDIHDFIGDCTTTWLLPTGPTVSGSTQFTPGAGSNFAQVNEATPDGDTTYVEDGTVGHIDTYAIADPAAATTVIKSIATVHYARKTDTGSRGMRAELRSNGGNAQHGVEISLGNNYQYYFSGWGQDPNNGATTNWTLAALTALEAGQTVSS